MIPTLYEPFRRWSEGGSVFILSDLHFDDADCKLMDPTWISPEEQLAIINKRVAKGDTFVCLGDVGDPKYIPMIKARKKILLLGNHDARGTYNGLFDEIYAGPLFISDKIFYHMNQYMVCLGALTFMVMTTITWNRIETIASILILQPMYAILHQ